ncbi:type VII secretion protein EccB [Spirillospora sp. NPDC029432]|uniref:type VII secretion protein EccB n=1 Tax=Spirillospora sp. NPDC029432 TaxID=3154599 RepID=UPI00345309A5
MQTRKDLYQAHRLMTQRVALALLQGQPSAAESPMRRTGVGTLCGVMVTVLVAAGFGIAGFLFKGGARNLEKPGVLIIEKETGATYAYSAETRKMVPFLNYTSARLAMPSTTVQTRSVSAKSLAKYGRGPLTGIPGAPESLPDPRKPAEPPWSLCVRTTDGRSQVTLAGGRDIGGRPLTDVQGVLVQAGAQPWLIWRSTRLRISPRAARVLTAAPPVPVDERWLNGLPQGADFAPPRIPGAGEPGIGRLFRVAAVAGTPERWYVQLADGLSSISQTQARLLLDAPGAPGPPSDISPGEAGERPSRTNLHSRALPERPPRIIAYTPADPLCAVYHNTDRLSTDARFTIGGSLPDARSRATNGLDQVTLPGGGAFAGTLAVPGQRPQAYSILTDQGVRHPVATREDVARLGYGTTAATPVPANLLNLFRTGPTLSSEAAKWPVPAS